MKTFHEIFHVILKKIIVEYVMLYFCYITETFHKIFPEIIYVIFLWNISCCVDTYNPMY